MEDARCDRSDYTPAPLLTRDNAEEDTQFTQEIRLASAANAPARLSNAAVLKWQTGVFLFTQNYDQNAVNSYAPFLIPQINFAASQHSPRSRSTTWVWALTARAR